MTTERMVELYLLTYYSYAKTFEGKPINVEAFYNRRIELLREFLNPYVIDNAEKSE